MHSEWQSLLEQAGAVIEHGAVQHYGHAAQEQQRSGHDDIIADLSHQAVVRVRGVDAEKFLQGQFTNDLRLLHDGHSHLSGYCSPKGRALAVPRFCRRDDDYYLILPTALVEPMVSRLRKYVLMSKVTFEVMDDWVHIGFVDRRGGVTLAAAVGGELPAAANDVTHFDGVSVIRLPGPAARYQLLGEFEAVRTIWERLRTRAAPVGAGPWEYLDIEAGLPAVYPETTDAFVPQMLNLDLLGGISFKKGCYTGQEVVARTHYLGKLKRRMFRLHCATATPRAAGTAIFNTALRADESAGTVVRAQLAPDGGVALLAVLQIDAAATGELRLGAIDGPSCALMPLPYAVIADKDPS